MDGFRRIVKDANRTVLGLFVAGTIGLGLWIGVRRSSLYDPIAEIPLALGITCLLGAASVSITRYTAGKIAHRVASFSPVQTRGVTVGNFGVAVVLLLVGTSFLTLLNGVLYFTFDRNWPVSPARAGEIHFLLLVGIVLTPAVVGVLYAGVRIRSS